MLTARELGLEAGVLRIQADKIEARRPSVLLLSGFVLGMLAERSAVLGDAPHGYLFPAR